MLSYIKFLMMMVLIFSIYLMSTSMEWLFIWTGMEINTMSFLSLTKIFMHHSHEFEFKYFIIQFIGSSLFLMSSLMDSNFFLFLSLSLKLMLLPFVLWILPCLNWINKELFINFLVLQKIGPLFIMISLVKVTKFCLMFIILNIIFSLFYIYNKNNMKSILLFSSIIQTSMLIFLINSDLSLSYMYMLIYIFSSFSTLYVLVYTSFSLMKSSVFFIISGFPPFFLFFLKLNFISIMVSLNMKIMCLIIIMSFSIMTYVYMKMMLKYFFINFYMKFFWFYKQPNFWYCLLILGLFMI